MRVVVVSVGASSGDAVSVVVVVVVMVVSVFWRLGEFVPWLSSETGSARRLCGVGDSVTSGILRDCR